MCLVWRVLVSALLSGAAVYAQTPGGISGAVPGKGAYAGEAVVVERLDTVYRYNADGTGTKLDTNVARLQTEAAVRGFGVLSLPYATGSQRIELVYLRVRKANGAVMDTPASDAQDQPAPVTQAAPFYSDLHLMQIPVRGLAVGDRLEYQVRTVITKAEAKDAFWGAESFGKGVVVLERSLELRVPAGKYVEVSSPKYPAKVSEEGGEKVYRWAGAQLTPTPKPKTSGQDTDADEGASAKDEDALPPIAWTTYHSWAEVGEWYRGLALERSAPTAAVKAKADEVVYGLTTPEAKIKALYAYVSSQVRYISVSLGVGRYQPHPAAEVLANQYGDCKDKHTLLAAMLRAENLPVSTVLIGAGMELDEAVPAPGWFNHEITLTGVDGAHEDLWLDTTPEVAPFRMLQAALRGKEALVIPPVGEPALRRTPGDPPFAAFTKFDASGVLSASGEMKAHVDVTMRGDDELNFREGLRTLPPAQWDRITQFYVRAEGFAGDPSNTVADLPEKTDTPLHMGYEYSRSPYGDWDNYRIIPMLPVLNLPMSDRKTAPAKDVEFGGKHTDTAVSKITLPAGFSADLPAEVHLQTEFAALNKSYRLEKTAGGEVLVTERTLAFKVDKLPPTQWAAYRKFLDDAGDSEPWIQLTSTGAHGADAGHHPPASGESNPVAAELVRQAGQLMEDKDWEGSTKKLDAAKAVNPRQELLWSDYGLIAAMSGKMNEAKEDYRRELEQHPGEGYASRALAGVQASQGDVPGAAKTLADSLALNNKDEAAWLMLGQLQARGDVPGAEKTLRGALEAMPGDMPAKLALGELLLREGKRDEGAQLLVGVANESEDPGQLNDAAYALGDASLSLPIAEAASRRSIRLLNAASARGENGVASVAALQRSMQLIASWDTYGWVLYREGSYSEAEPWLKAAWADSLSWASGQHLSKLYEKQGRAADAARLARLSAQGDGAPNRAGVPRSGQPMPVGMGTAARGGEARAALQNERTFPVPKLPDTAEGWAVFEMEYAINTKPIARLVQGENGLAPMAEALAKTDTHTSIPPGSSAHLLRRGVLSCHTGAMCTFVMQPNELAAMQ